MCSQPVWQQRMIEEDWRGLTPLIYHHVNPYVRAEHGSTAGAGSLIVSGTIRFLTLLTVSVQHLVKLVAYTPYNSDIYFVQKTAPCHEFLLTVGCPTLEQTTENRRLAADCYSFAG